MDEKEIADILKAHINANPHDALLQAVKDHRARQSWGNKHFCTITGIDRAAAALKRRMEAADV